MNKEIILQNPDRSIANSLSTCHREEIEENRRHVYYLAMALLYLSRQGLAIRGHDESGYHQIEEILLSCWSCTRSYKATSVHCFAHFGWFVPIPERFSFVYGWEKCGRLEFFLSRGLLVLVTAMVRGSGWNGRRGGN